MSRNRLSPLTIKKDLMQSNKRQNDNSLDDQVQTIQYRLKNIHFSESQQRQLKQLWDIYIQTKQAENNIKILNQNLQEFGGIPSTPNEKGLKNNKNSSFQGINSHRHINCMLNQTQQLKNQLNTQINRANQFSKHAETEKLRQAVQNKQQLAQKIMHFQKQLHGWINQVKVYSTSSKLAYDQVLNKKIRQSQAFMQFQKKCNKYKNIIGMARCVKKNMQDVELGAKVKEKYLKLVNVPGNKNKKSMKDILIDVEKKQKLQKINRLIEENDNEILCEANYLKNQIKEIESLYQTQNIQIRAFSQKKFTLAFQKLQKLSCKIEGLIDKYQEDLQKLQQLLTLSKPKLYSIQHKDTQLAHSFRKFSQQKQRWEDLARMLMFQYCNY